MLRFLALAFLGLMAGCAASPDQIAAADHATCIEMGIDRGDPRYPDCRMALMQNRTIVRATQTPAQRWGWLE